MPGECALQYFRSSAAAERVAVCPHDERQQNGSLVAPTDILVGWNCLDLSYGRAGWDMGRDAHRGGSCHVLCLEAASRDCTRWRHRDDRGRSYGHLDPQTRGEVGRHAGTEPGPEAGRFIEVWNGAAHRDESRFDPSMLRQPAKFEHGRYIRVAAPEVAKHLRVIRGIAA